MAYTCDIHWKYHVFVVFWCFRQNEISGEGLQMYLPCIIVYFGCIRGLDDVLTSNTSKYIQYIGPVNSGCIGKIWMYCVCIEDVSDVLDVLRVYWICIMRVFRVYCEFMWSPYQNALPVAVWQLPFALPPSKDLARQHHSC